MMQSLSTIKELYKGERPPVMMVITVLVVVELAITLVLVVVTDLIIRDQPTVH
jgi:hypothetical protein